jgi:hypothetical protein
VITDIGRAKREVIEGKLLAALDDESKVAIVLSENDLRFLISCVRFSPDGWGEKRRVFLQDLERLADEAFGRKDGH